MIKKKLHIEEFILESREKLRDLTVTFHHREGSGKTVWIFHALSASSDPFEWWLDVMNGSWLSPDDQLICVNMLGSCYGTEFSTAIDSKGDLVELPLITVRDNAKLFSIVAEYLSVDRIDIGIGGSLGGSCLLEWKLIQSDLFDKVIALASSTKESVWGKAAHYAQRKALREDEFFNIGKYDSATRGIMQARTIGMLTYRSRASFEVMQADEESLLKDFQVESYLKYQEKKFAERFDAKSYFLLSQTLDTHDIFRDRREVIIKGRVLLIGISTDYLCSIQDQEQLLDVCPEGKMKIIESIYGHDGFLVESKKINELILQFLEDEKQ